MSVASDKRILAKKMITEFCTKKILNSGMVRISGQGIRLANRNAIWVQIACQFFFKDTRWNSESDAQLFIPEKN